MVTLMSSLLSRSSLWGIFALLCAINIWDAASTAILVNHWGNDIEANPIMRHALDSYGIPGLYMMKFAVLGFLGLIVAYVNRYYKEHRASTMVRRSMWVLSALIGLIVINNLILVYYTLTI